VEHRQHRSLNNRAEHSHQPTRQRERRMQGFQIIGQAPRFLSAYVPSPNTSVRDATGSPRLEYRQEMAQRFQSWREITGTL